MTIVIVASFLLCSTPYFIVDFWRVYGGQTISPMIWAIIASLAVSNSATNPFVFLGFNSTGQWWLTLCQKGQTGNPRRNYSGGTTTLQTTHSEHIILESIRIPGGDVRSDPNGGCGSSHQTTQLTTTLTTLSEKAGACITNSVVTTTIASDSNREVHSAVNCVVVATDCNGISSAL